jgi:hypothetical protein
MTAILNGEFDASALPIKGRTTQATEAIPAPTTKLRLETDLILFLFLLASDVGPIIQGQQGMTAGHALYAVTGLLGLSWQIWP